MTEVDMNAQERRELKLELLRKDLETYRKLETWGASLFLGALALIGKQLFEWDVNMPNKLHGFVFAAPAVIGMVAFVFLRLVNHRMHKTQIKLWDFVRDTSEKPWGVLGIVLALLPVVSGLFVSWALTQRYEILFGGCFMAALVAAVIHVVKR